MKRRIVFLSLVFLFILSVSAPAATLEEIQARGYVRVGLFPHIPPFTYTDDQGNYAGFDVEIMTEIAKIWEVNVRWVPLESWVDNIPGLQNRRFDVFVAPMTITTKRAQSVAFALPHFNAGQVVVVRSDNDIVNSHHDLNGRTVAAVKGTTPQEAAEDIEGAKVTLFNNEEENVSCVLEGSCDAFVTDRPVALAVVKRHNGKLKIVGEPFTIEYYGYAVNKNDTELMMQLNQALTILKENATYDIIVDKWFK